MKDWKLHVERPCWVHEMESPRGESEKIEETELFQAFGLIFFLAFWQKEYARSQVEKCWQPSESTLLSP